MTERETVARAMPRYFAVWSATGVHVGVWEDGKIASDVLSEYPGGTMRELIEVSSALDAMGEREARVKSLSWIDYDCDAVAKSAVADYNIYETRPGRWNACAYPMNSERLRVAEDVDGREQAKTAAQADYARRIRSALKVCEREVTPLGFYERLLLDLWEAVEDQTDTETQDTIADLCGWSALVGTIAGLRERSDEARALADEPTR